MVASGAAPVASVVVSNVVPVFSAAAGVAPVVCVASGVTPTLVWLLRTKSRPPWRYLKWLSLRPQSQPTSLEFVPGTNIDYLTRRISLSHGDLDAQTDDFGSPLTNIKKAISCPSKQF